MNAQPSAAGHESLGLMMTTPLTTQILMARRATAGRETRVVSVGSNGAPNRECTGAEIADRATRLAAGLSRLGIKPGDRVATLAWNTREHVETYWAVTGLGAVLHTVNLRLFPEQLTYTINHARDSVLIVDASLVSTLLPILDGLHTLNTVVVINDGTATPSDWPDNWLNYEDVLIEDPEFAWPAFPEDTGAALCYTSGTTGKPKGVLYSHRSIVLHALSMSGSGGFELGPSDRVLALVPLFHALGWGLPFIAAVTKCDLILPGRSVTAKDLLRVIPEEKVTWAGGVPTLWMDLLREIDLVEESGRAVDLGQLKTVLTGGTKVPVPLMKAFHDRWGINLVQGWGMTETLPGATLCMESNPSEVDWHRRGIAGQASPLYQFRVVSDDGHVLPADGVATGEIEVRGPVVARAYLDDAASSAKFHDGWLRTGDVGTLTADGCLAISDRAKDVIKSGGEWISSQDLESALIDHPEIYEAAVIGVPDDRWSERPLAFVVCRSELTVDDVKKHLEHLVARWWIPEAYVFVSEIPRNSTGKADKKALRAMAPTTAAG